MAALLRRPALLIQSPAVHGPEDSASRAASEGGRSLDGGIGGWIPRRLARGHPAEHPWRPFRGTRRKNMRWAASLEAPPPPPLAQRSIPAAWRSRSSSSEVVVLRGASLGLRDGPLHWVGPPWLLRPGQLPGPARWARSLGSLPGPPACPLPAWPRGDCPGGGLRDGLGGPNGPFGQGAGLRGPIVRSGQKPGLGARKEPLHGFGADGEPALTPPICIPKLHRESPVWACRQVCAPDHPRASWGVRVQRFRTLHGRPFPRWGRLEGSFQIARVVRNRRVKLMLISPLRLRADPLGAPLMG